jgi:2-hydroxychromene-2-carboxylate isomerase
MAERPVLEFWYEFASTYSYLAAMRIETLAEAAGVDIQWRPFLLGPIFAAQGWTTSPFNLYPAKGRYMWRDMEREAQQLGLPLVQPDPFPQNALLAARVALVGADHPWCPTFTKAVYRAEFGERRNIAEPEVIRGVLVHMGLDAEKVLTVALTDENKAGLKANTEEALARGVFGAPAFFAPDGEMFWGNDRLDQALAWTASRSGERLG